MENKPLNQCGCGNYLQCIHWSLDCKHTLMLFSHTATSPSQCLLKATLLSPVELQESTGDWTDSLKLSTGQVVVIIVVVVMFIVSVRLNWLFMCAWPTWVYMKINTKTVDVLTEASPCTATSDIWSFLWGIGPRKKAKKLNWKRRSHMDQLEIEFLILSCTGHLISYLLYT